MALISRYVSDASTYYQRTDFDGDGLQDNIHFGIDTLFIELDAPTSGDFTATNIGVELFLQRHSEADFSDFCLSYRFTHRDFDNGVLGLAYVAAQPPSGLIGEDGWEWLVKWRSWAGLRGSTASLRLDW